MVSLFIMRHAQSGPKSPQGRDFDRTLDAGGRKQPLLIAKELANDALSIDQVLVSPALRTKETWALMRLKIPQVFYDQRLYNAALPALWEVLEEHTQAQGLLLIGHNPALSALVYDLSNAIHDFEPADVVILHAPERSLGLALGKEKAFRLERILRAQIL